MNPICSLCRVELTCQRNGVIVESGNGFFRGDLYACPSCDVHVILCARTPMVEPYEPHYDAVRQAEQARWPIIVLKEN